MAWRQLLLTCLSAVALLSMLREGAAVSVGLRQVAGQEAQEDVEEIFMQESDALNFLKKRSKRSPRFQDKVNVENRQKLRADELWREYHEKQRNEFENFVEEQNNDKSSSAEQEERSWKAIEQWRQWHYDGLYPSSLYNRHHI